MKKLLIGMLLAVVCLLAIAAGSRFSQLLPTATMGPNDVFLVNTNMGVAPKSRIITGSNAINALAPFLRSNAIAQSAVAGLSEALENAGSGVVDGVVTNGASPDFADVHLSGSIINSDESGYEKFRAGTGAGEEATYANDIVMIGDSSGRLAANANDCIFIGEHSGEEAARAWSSAFFGSYSGAYAVRAQGSFFAGESSGTYATNGSRSIFIGPFSGIDRSNTLWIDTMTGPDDFVYDSPNVWRNTRAPLIYGEFDNRLLRINGDLEVTGSIIGAGVGSSGDVTADGDNVFSGSNTVTGSLSIPGTFRVGRLEAEHIAADTIVGTNISAGQIGTNHLDAGTYALITGQQTFPLGLTTNVSFLTPDSLTNTFQFSGGILTNVVAGLVTGEVGEGEVGGGWVDTFALESASTTNDASGGGASVSTLITIGGGTVSALRLFVAEGLYDLGLKVALFDTNLVLLGSASTNYVGTSVWKTVNITPTNLAAGTYRLAYSAQASTDELKMPKSSSTLNALHNEGYADFPGTLTAPWSETAPGPLMGLYIEP